MFQIKISRFNGYTCPCCFQKWDGDDVWVESLEDALKYLEHPKNEEFEEIKTVKVIEGITGKIVAECELDWPWITKYDGNNHEKWHGHINNVPFESIKSSFGSGLTWDQICTRLKIEKAKKDLDKAQETYQKVQEVYDALNTQ